MGIKQLYNDNLRTLPNEYGDISIMVIKSLTSFYEYPEFPEMTIENIKHKKPWILS